MHKILKNIINRK